MSIEIDTILFVKGPRAGQNAVMLECKSLFWVYELDGSEIMSWDGQALQLNAADWTDEMRRANQWLTDNTWDFVPAATPLIGKKLREFADFFAEVGPVAINSNSSPAGERP